MILKVINSNSSGNCYILESDSSALLIECGVKFDRIKQAIDFKLNKIDACIVSHEHGDHSMSFNEVLRSGIPVIASEGTKRALNVKELVPSLRHGWSYGCKGWKISAFNVDHDAAEPLGFIIEHPECGRVLFVTDTYILRYKFEQPFDHVIIEANYCEDLSDDWKEYSGKGNDFVEGRRLKNHMSFQTAIKTLERMDLSQCKNIVLIHLSDGLTDSKRFKQATEQAFGIPTTVAIPGANINFGIKPY
jgi:phosphoribosyl 1,2-cyclic phosphodiesterase